MPKVLLNCLLRAILAMPALALPAPLRVVVDENYPPFVYRNADGKLEGYEVDVWNLWQKKTGVAVELAGANWADAQRMLLQGGADVIDPILRTPAREAQYDFSPPFTTVTSSIYADASIAGIHDVPSLKGFEVAVQEGDACGDKLQAAGITSVRSFPTYAALMAAAADQSVKLFCLDQYSADYHLYRLALQRKYVKAFDMYHEQLRHGVRRGDTRTLALVNRGMAQITRDETAALHDKWIGRPLVFSRYAELLAQGLLALALLVLLLAIWLGSVRRAVRIRTLQLEREKTQLRTLVESSPDLIWLKDTAGAYIACNGRVAALLGKERGEIVGRTDYELFGPATAELLWQDDMAALRAGRPVICEDHLVCPGGGTRLFETIKTPVIQPDGAVLGVLGVSRDITERKLYEETIRAQDLLLKEMSSLARIGAWELDPATRILRLTDEVARIFEARLAAPFTLAAALGFYCGASRALLERAVDDAVARGEPFDLELEIVSGGGTRKWVRAICSPVRANGKTAKLRGTLQDVTERRGLEESMRMANLIYQTSSEAIVVTDDTNDIVDANPAFTQQTGYQLRDVLGTRPSLFSSSMHDSGFYQQMWQQLLANDHWQGEILDRNKDGSFTAKSVNIRLVRYPDGRIYRHVVQFHDISEQKQKDELIWRQTNFDSLTGLPNRRLFLDRLQQEVKKAHVAHRSLGVLLLDLDHFKDINDSFGHATGDQALIALTQRLAGCVPESATIARLSGDTFAAVVSEFDQRLHLEETAEAVIAAVAVPLRFGPDQVAYVSASVGISVYPDDATQAADLVTDAEHAMYLAKKAGRGRFQYFTPSLQHQARVKLMLTNDLRQALARGQLHVHYQPIVEVASGRIRKAEALLRWSHPERGMISPSCFIPLAEESGLIDEIGDWVLRQAIASIERWREQYGSAVELSVNISPLQFEHAGPLPWLERVVRSGLPPDSITVEITEGVLVRDSEQAMACLKTLRASGAKVSIDDFGTGFSALAYLKHFDVDYLKIDKSFIKNLTDDGSDKALTEAIIDIAHKLGIEAIAEGVETRAQRDMLAGFGCDYIQGHFYSSAVSRDAFEGLLKRQMVY
ncbi:MAG: EAL domain-containing protein [Massilia sp.]